MKKIGITVEIVRRYYEEVEISDEQYGQLADGEVDEVILLGNKLADVFEKCRSESATDDSDYAITDENGENIIGWDRY